MTSAKHMHSAHELCNAGIILGVGSANGNRQYIIMPIPRMIPAVVHTLLCFVVFWQNTTKHNKVWTIAGIILVISPISSGLSHLHMDTITPVQPSEIWVNESNEYKKAWNNYMNLTHLPRQNAPKLPKISISKDYFCQHVLHIFCEIVLGWIAIMLIQHWFR